jgi:hypothetical protein
METFRGGMYMRVWLLAFLVSLLALPALAQCGGGGGGGGGGGCSGGGYCPPECMSCGPNLFSLIAFKTQPGPWHLTGVGNGVSFDIDGSGTKRKVAWTTADSEIAFLALDRNGNGVIDDATELFGFGTPLLNGNKARSGFIALADFDMNHDGVIDPSDPVWSSLLLWIDRNHDGLSQPDELVPIASSGMTSIHLRQDWQVAHDQSENYFGYTAQVHFGPRVERFHDIFFAVEK